MIIHWQIVHLIRLKTILCLSVVYITSVQFLLPVQAQQFELPGKRKKEVINFTKVKNLIVIPVYINEKGPYNFLLDTGVGQMIITDTTFLKEIDLTNHKTYKIQGYGLGTEIEAILVRSINARVGRASIKNIPTAIFKHDIFDLSSYLGIKIHGILGYFFFRSFTVKINYASNKITCYLPDSNTKIKGTPVPMPVINAKPYVNVNLSLDSVTKTQVKLLVDNGSSHPLMLESINDGPFPIPPNSIPANLGVGINGEITGVMGRVHAMDIDEFTFKDILAGFPDYSPKRTELEGNSRNGSLGAEVLKHFLVTFDYKNEILYLKKTRAFRQRFDHDMSGLEIYVIRSPRDRYYVSRIEPGSPAEKVGLKENDEIVSVDFKGIENYNLSELTEMFRDRDGKQMILEIRRNNETILVLLKLKRRI